VENQFHNSHTITCRTDLAHPDIHSDPDLLRNIFVNLLSNAIKFSPGKSAVFVDVSQADGFMVADVRDEGIGIPLEEQERIFSPFDRGTNAFAIAGTGLGLSIVKKAVDLMDGVIIVKSAPGEGSVFSISIPL
jgi:signal transduction histidine kinase